jgi:phosphinothricin acetyltransferase
MIIRPAEELDLSTILEIYNHSIVHTTAVYSYHPLTYAYIDSWFRQKQEDGFPVIVAVSNAQVVGFASFGQFRNWPAYKRTAEHTVHIHPEFQRLGIASQLILRIIDEAKQRNMHTLIGGVDGANSGSIKLHEKLGFQEVAHFRQVGYKFDKWLDLKFFQLILG